jgi:RHS repeat-associated protein
VTGSYQLGGRTYQPGKASFLNPDTYRTAPPSKDLSVQTDPLTENRYSYVNGDPVNLVDPDGHKLCRPNDPSDYCDAYRGNPMTQEEVQHIVDARSGPGVAPPPAAKPRPRPTPRSCSWWNIGCLASPGFEQLVDEHGAEIVGAVSFGLHAASGVADAGSENLIRQGEKILEGAANDAAALRATAVATGRGPVGRWLAGALNSLTELRANVIESRAELEAGPKMFFGGVLRVVGKSLLVVGTAVSGAAAYQEDINDPENKLTGDERVGHALLVGGYAATFSTVGAVGLGALCAPSLVGAFGCAAAGAIAGDWTGKKVGGLAYEAGQLTERRYEQERIPMVSPY